MNRLKTVEESFVVQRNHGTSDIWHDTRSFRTFQQALEALDIYKKEWSDGGLHNFRGRIAHRGRFEEILPQETP